MDGVFLMNKLYTIFLILVFLGCENDVTGLDDILDNPLDENEVDYEVPAFVFYPAQFDVSLGASFQAEVYAMGAENLRGVNVVLEYNPNKLALQNVNNGALATGTNPMFFTDTDTPGQVEIVAVYISSDSSSVDGNIKIAELVFSTTSIGSSTLDFLPECEMLDQDDNLIEIKGFAQGVVNAQ